MRIRQAEPEDAEAIAAVFTPSFATLTFLPRLHTAEEDRWFVSKLLLPRHEVWVAEEGGRLIGFAALSEDMLDHLYVHPHAQGRGVGAALLAKAQERRPDGFSLWCFQQNEQARRFYDAHGCRVVRLTDGSTNEYRSPDVLYEWRP